MKIAVTYDNGNIFQHFGKTEQFKIYNVENNQVVSSEVIGNDGVGHEALAGLLADNAVQVLICGGMGAGAAAALEEAGIDVHAGVEGDADASVEAFLQGTLEKGGVNCDHHDHHHEEEQQAQAGGCNCGSDCGSNCGGGCSGCGGGAPQILYDGKNAGKVVHVHYTGTLNDGTKFDSSYDRGEPLKFVSGIGQMIDGFDRAVVNMNVGEVLDIHLMPEEAYGEPDPDNIIELQLSQLAGAENLNVGEQAYIQDQYGRPYTVTVTAKTEDSITLDANSELAGKELNFHIELVEVEE